MPTTTFYRKKWWHQDHFGMHRINHLETQGLQDRYSFWNTSGILYGSFPHVSYVSTPLPALPCQHSATCWILMNFRGYCASGLSVGAAALVQPVRIGWVMLAATVEWSLWKLSAAMICPCHMPFLFKGTHAKHSGMAAQTRWVKLVRE